MSKVSATYGLTQSPLVMSTAGSVGVGFGVDVDAGGGVLVDVGLGEGWGVAIGVCVLDAQAATINEPMKIK
jgi:hypothetical protein